MPARSPKNALRKRLAIVWAGFVLVLSTLNGQEIFEQPYFGMSLRGARVEWVVEDGPAAGVGIEPGDRILEIQRHHADRLPFLGEQLYSGALGREVAITIEGGSGVRSVTLTATDRPVADTWREVARLVTSVAFLLIGLYAALRLEVRQTTLFYLLCSVFSILMLPSATPDPSVTPIVLGALRGIASLLLPPLFLHFFLLFPRSIDFARRHGSVIVWLYVPTVVALALFAYVTSSHFWPASGVDAVAQVVFLIIQIQAVIYAVLALASFVAGYVNVRSPAERRRYSVALWATLIGIAPILIATLSHTIWPQRWWLWEEFTPMALLLVPGGFAYAIVRHHIFDIEVIVKRSAVFSIVTFCLVVIAIGIYLTFGRVLESLTGERSRWLMVGIIVIIAGIFSPLRQRVEAVVDRMFFRDRYDERRVLRELGQSLPGILNLRDLITEVVDKLSRTLRVREAALFVSLNGNPEYPISYASGLPAEDLDLPPVPKRFLRAIQREQRPLRTSDIEDSLPFGPVAPDEERHLDVFDGGVFVPIGQAPGLLGVLALGRRAGDESYGLEDLELLQAIAGQAMLGMRNALMHKRAVEQERIARELAVARELQSQLLPHADPSFARIEISGSMTPCTEVGGDFYDYLPLGRNRLGIAVGDVCGHGIPAALIMASLSATLRAEADRNPTPGELLGRLNQRACEALEPGQFLSLFYGVLDADSATLRYANAGHPPPLVIDPAGKVIQLATGGLLLGVDRRSVYITETTRCSPGSVALFFTDGLVEARRGETEFGEDRLIALVRDNGALTADALRRRILTAAADYIDGDAEDDITLIVVRVPGES